MEVRKIGARNVETGKKSFPKSGDNVRVEDSFSTADKGVGKIGLSAEEISGIILGNKDKKTSSGDLVQKIKKQIDAAQPEIEKIQREHNVKLETIKKLLLDKTTDPHIYRRITTDGSISTRPVVRKDGSIVAGGGDGIITEYLTAFSPTGKILWRSSDMIEKNPAVDSEGNFYFATNNSTVSYDKDGNKRWQFSRYEKAPGFVEYDSENALGDCSGASGVPAIDEKRNTIYFGEWYGKIFAVDKDTGKVKWVRNRPGMIGSCDPVLDRDGNLFINDDDGFAMSLKPDGTYNWKVSVGGGGSYAIGTSPILVGKDQKVVFGTRDGKLVSLNHDTGEVEMSFNADEAIYNKPLNVGKDRVVFNNSKGHVFCVDTSKPVNKKNGQEMKLLWEKKLSEHACVHLVDDQGKIYASDGDKGLVVFNPDGSIAYRAAITPSTGITQSANGDIWTSNNEDLIQIKPLSERFEDLKKSGQLQEDESSKELKEKSSTITVEKDWVNIGGVVLPRQKKGGH